MDAPRTAAVELPLPADIAGLLRDYRLLDTWALPVRGRSEDFDVLVEVVQRLDLAHRGSPAVRGLIRARSLLGRVLAWDERRNEAAVGGQPDRSGRERFTVLAQSDRHWLGGIDSRHVDAIMHLAWIPVDERLWTGRMAVYARTRGAFGPLYLAAIRPFRHRVIYPAMLRTIERDWSSRAARSG